MKKLVIDRKRWLHGEGSQVSVLLRPSDGKMCCLGFYMKSLRKTNAELVDTPSPSYLQIKGVPDWLLTEEVEDSKAADKLMKLNDNPRVKDREEKIAAIFAKHDVKVSFIGTNE